MSASCVDAVRHRVPRTGGIRISTWDQQFSFNPTGE